jgi:short-subunit dehydrogenase involved in D-alanine esterification of teichoic acids
MNENNYKIDCLINNSGRAEKIDLKRRHIGKIPLDLTKVILDTNYRSALKLNAYLTPNLSEDAKMINVSSLLG